MYQDPTGDSEDCDSFNSYISLSSQMQLRPTKGLVLTELLKASPMFARKSRSRELSLETALKSKSNHTSALFDKICKFVSQTRELGK